MDQLGQHPESVGVHFMIIFIAAWSKLWTEFKLFLPESVEVQPSFIIQKLLMVSGT